MNNNDNIINNNMDENLHIITMIINDYFNYTKPNINNFDTRGSKILYIPPARLVSSGQRWSCQLAPVFSSLNKKE